MVSDMTRETLHSVVLGNVRADAVSALTNIKAISG
uniref:Uncharacterized protein n=1 Tax=Candidatus Kentrum sp. MB TaxID=2138164 RepID=A0A451B942_9GAMM|nr:MAG: hypothetical protein BECKMB1821G_GA0114241_104434 [Candidatus Kentron sp. MB]VFK29515.1 MAG: hypothetical protein BECKMB1821I_GA0114274_101040 [Candidatus Kentron sp. MB]VFK74813.1 MAG: hypothetical protein BECKMB1821H_GA0114242_101040 [Candidatus Kentron sp. MB]